MVRHSVAVGLVGMLVLVEAGGAQDVAGSVSRAPEIVVSGEGARSVPADRASVFVSVETRARTPSEAGALNAARNNAIRAAVAAIGVPRDDITTSGYTVYAMRQEPPYTRDTGYVATNSVRVLLRRAEQLPLLGRIIDTALTAGATHIAGVRHEARLTDEAEREALAEALTDARARAEAVARAAGGSLGELLHVTTNFAAIPTTGMEYSGAMRRASARARAEPTTVSAAEIEVRQHVTARWRFVPRQR